MSGAAVRALGYPFGDALEIGKPDTTLEFVPDVTVSRGAVSRLRRDVSGEVRYVQTTAPLNPGSSGGPIVFEDGYVVAVAQRGLSAKVGSGVGFGIPVNLVRQFLRRHGFDRRPRHGSPRRSRYRRGGGRGAQSIGSCRPGWRPSSPARCSSERCHGAPTRWTPVAVGTTRTSLVVPDGWVVESRGPSRCGGVGGGRVGAIGFAGGRLHGSAPRSLAAGGNHGPHPSGARLRPARRSVRRRVVRRERGSMGHRLRGRGRFRGRTDRGWHLEVVAPAARSAQARGLFGAWVTAIVGTA